MNKKVRDSNYELLRIVSMIFIVAWHVILHGKILQQTNDILNFVFNFVMALLVVHVNCFMLITGYYQYKSNFKWKKVVSLVLQIAFYNLVINSIFKIFGLVEYTNIEFLKQIFFFNFDSYWFFRCYIIVYVFSPFLNKLIDLFDKKRMKTIILCCFMCFSILPFITGNLFFPTDGFSVYQFVFMYFVGAYIRKFDFNKEFMKKNNITQKRFLYIVVYILCAVFNFSLFCTQLVMNGLSSNISQYIGGILSLYNRLYNNPLIVIQSISLFLLFGTYNFKNKIINKISSLTFGVYLIHESYYMRINLYKWIGIDKGHMLYGKTLILKAFIWIIIIFVLCSIIEWIRQLLFKMISKLKIARKIDNKFMTWLINLTEVK